MTVPSPPIDGPQRPVQGSDGGDSQQLLARAQQWVPRLREHSADIERGRRVPAELAAQLARSGMFRMLLPHSLNGYEASAEQMVRTLATLAEGDAAVAWCVMTGVTTSLLSAYLDQTVAQRLWADDPDLIMAGVFAPRGKALAVEGGYRLSGRWSFTSGCQNASWVNLGALVVAANGSRDSQEGRPQLRSLFVPAAELRVIDTWDVMGLCGTGSHDVQLDDVFVPAERTASVMNDKPQHPGALYRFPIFGLLASGVAAVALGVARAAVDAVKQLAHEKRSFGGRSLAKQEAVQLGVAHAEAELSAGRAWLLQSCAEATAAAEQGALGLAQRATLRLAATHATRCARQAVDRMYQLGGGSALYRRSPLQRHFRDIATVTQHIMVAPASDKTVGRVLLGVETDVSQL